MRLPLARPTLHPVLPPPPPLLHRLLAQLAWTLHSVAAPAPHAASDMSRSARSLMPAKTRLALLPTSRALLLAGARRQHIKPTSQARLEAPRPFHRPLSTSHRRPLHVTIRSQMPSLRKPIGLGSSQILLHA